MARLLTIINFLFLTFPWSIITAELNPRTIDCTFADSLAAEQVIYRGRIAPFHTVALDITRKLTGNSSYRDLDAVRFVGSLMIYKDDWKGVDFIKVKEKALIELLELDDRTDVALSDLFYEDGEFILENVSTDDNENLRDAISDIIIKVEILEMLQNNRLYTPLSFTKHRTLPSWRIELEIFYNKANFTGWCYIVAFFVGFIGLFLCSIIKRRVVFYLFMLVTAVAIVAFVLRWIIGSHIPLDSSEQVMMFTFMILSIIATLLSRKEPWIATGCIFMGGFTAMVAHLSMREAVVTTLSSALSSPWLAFHVSVIMISYALLAALLPISVYLVLSHSKRTKIDGTIFFLNIAGVIMLGIGILLGSLWAKEAWGSYWSWDPKENWAAITFCAYLIPIVFHKKLKSKPRLYGCLLIISFIVMGITYFGVNYMSSMHTYGS